MITLIRTCGACPEQYDAKNEAGETIGYLRLRHGRFTVQVPDVGGKMIYEAKPKGDGIFDTEERQHYLKRAVQAIERTLDPSLPIRSDDEVKFNLQDDWSGDYE